MNDPPPPRDRAAFAQDADVNARPIVRADCIKFVHTFRNQFSVEQLLALMPMLIAHLQSEHVSSCLPVGLLLFLRELRSRNAQQQLDTAHLQSEHASCLLLQILLVQ